MLRIVFGASFPRRAGIVFGGGATCSTNLITRASFNTILASLILGFVLEIRCPYLWHTYGLMIFFFFLLMSYTLRHEKKKN